MLTLIEFLLSGRRAVYRPGSRAPAHAVVRGRPCTPHLLLWSGSQTRDGALDLHQVSTPTDVTKPPDIMSVSE